MKSPARFAFVTALALLAVGTAAWAQAPLKVGEVRAYRAASPNPYPQGRMAREVTWTDRVVSPGAEFVRVHFTGLDLAPGDYLTVSSPDRSQVWVYSDRGPKGDGDVWSFAVTGDTAIVEIHAGPGRGRSPRGYQIDSVGHGTVRLDSKPVAPTPEVICGTDGTEDVACHLREKGFEEAQSPVARLLFVSGGFFYLCTGWLADGPNDSTLVTNNHCISSQKEADTLQASFNFQATRCGGSTIAPVSDYAGGLLLKTNNLHAHGRKDGLDYTLMTLQGNPEATWGELHPSSRGLAVGDLIWFIQHPGGRRKAVGYWEDAEQTVRCKLDAVDQSLRGVAAGSQTYYGCDSEGGSSGSPIVDPETGHAIALHHFGGITSNPCLNGGTEMAPICADAGSLLNCVAD